MFVGIVEAVSVVVWSGAVQIAVKTGEECEQYKHMSQQLSIWNRQHSEISCIYTGSMQLVGM